MKRRRHRIVPWQRRLLYGSGAVLLLSGLAWLAVHYSVGGGTGELPHAAEPWLMRLHGLAMLVWLFSQGTLAAAHVPQGWRSTGRHRWAGQRNSGVMLCVSSGLLAATGYLLYYGAPEALRPTVGWLHSLVGVAIAVLLLTHRRHAVSRPGAQPAVSADHTSADHS